MNEMTDFPPVIESTSKLASQVPPPHAKPAVFTPVKVKPFVILVITDQHGEVRGSLSAEDEAMAIFLRNTAAQTTDNPPPVARRQDSLTPLGQDIYVVDRDFVLKIQGMFWLWEGGKDLAQTLPSSCFCTFVVNF